MESYEKSGMLKEMTNRVPGINRRGEPNSIGIRPGEGVPKTGTNLLL